MKVALDATPLLDARTGVGTYTANLLAELPRLHPEVDWTATAFTLRGSDLASELPPGIAANARRFPARLLRRAWTQSAFPPTELLAGRSDVFHATNFVLPPSRHAAGVLTIHDLAYLTQPATVSARSREYVELVPLSIQRARVICTPSDAVAAQVRDAYRVGNRPVIATHLGVKPTWSTAEPTEAVRRRYGLPTRYLVAVGTLEPRKNLQRLLSAYATVRDLPPLVLSGGQGWGERLDVSGIPAARLILTGHLPYPDLQSVVAGAEALLMPSLDEGFGLPPLEALACGVPVLASDIDVSREILGNQATLVDPLDVDSIAHGLIAVTSDPAGTSASRRRHAAGFTWENCAKDTYEAYQIARSMR